MRVCGLVAQNLNAMRYFCHVDQNYYCSMSSTTKAEVEQHGGAMSPEEASAFQNLASFKASIALRHCCDSAAATEQESASQAGRRRWFGRYRALLEDHLGEQFAHHSLWEDLGQQGTYHVKR